LEWEGRERANLDVAFSNDAKVADNIDGRGAESVIVAIRESLAGCHNNGVARVDSEGIKIFHVANGNAVVVDITDDLVFDFLPALQGLLDQDLGCDGKRLLA